MRRKIFVLELNSFKNKYSRLVAMSVLTSFLGIQACAISQVLPEHEYKILPPVVDQKSEPPQMFNSVHPPAADNHQQFNNYQPNSYNMNSPLQGRVATIPLGTTFQAITSNAINSYTNKVGEKIIAKIAEPITVNGQIIIPPGSEIIGQITYIENSGRIGKNGVMEVKFTGIELPYSHRIPVMGKILTIDNTGILKGGSVKKQLARTVSTGAVTTAGGTLAGLGIGSVVGGAAATGAAVGTAIGGVLGIVFMFARKGKEVVIPRGTKLNIVLEHPVTVGR